MTPPDTPDESTDTSLDAIEAMARATIADFPEPFKTLAAPVVLRVEDWPEAEVLQEFGITDPLELTGLYDGLPMTEKSLSDPAPFADVVWLYRRPILSEWCERDGVPLNDVVANVTVHEFAHHFGWSDDDIAAIDRWWE
ncbi:metallopeptidase family protein [Roseovarius sp. LXJ103]|uniref:metallopeptidase family protein n=1 Tax=Roseovarius carneus TaxID=2853164 RepID=UPI000D61A1A1|nr:metallopeptidase family protein [Roseovarius carneus]MBZ8118331.1 metallopeptidase family protein [Roseovarius carneus]PWE35954.1 neutral zinc metallopeptidase [Pelagicola sp. LXJ1103]